MIVCVFLIHSFKTVFLSAGLSCRSLINAHRIAIPVIDIHRNEDEMELNGRQMKRDTTTTEMASSACLPLFAWF